MSRTPQQLARECERVDGELVGTDEAMSGYAAAQMFASGHIFNLRRFTVTTLEGPFTSLWHRDPTGTWTFFVDAPPTQACPRYFGARIAASAQTAVELDWKKPDTLVVRADEVEWSMTMRATTSTRAMNLLVWMTPAPLLRRPGFLRLVERLLPVLGLGRVSLVGTAPNGQSFEVTGQDVWKVVGGRATVDGEDVGPPGVLDEQPRLGDYWVPRDIFAVIEAHFEALDPGRHTTQTSG